MIRYILGRTGSGKSRWVHNHIAQNIGHEKLLLIVPEQYTLQAEIDLIHDLKSKGIMEVEVMSFNRLCHRIIEETGPLQVTEIDALGKAMVLRSLLDEHHEELKVFSSISRKPGFIEKISTLISEFKRVGIESGQLSNKIDTEDLLVYRKLADISKIMTYYDRFMENGYFDEEDRLKMVIEKIEKSEVVTDAIVYLDGFDSFSSQEYTILSKILMLSKEVNLSLTLDIHSDNASEQLFSPVVKTLKKVRSIVETLSLPEKRVEVSKENPKEDLRTLENEFFAYPYKAFEGEIENIEVHISNNGYEEIELLAKSIVDYVKLGYRYKDLSIVTGAIEEYHSIVRRVFTEYKIPYFIDEKVGVMGHPIVQYILASLSCLHSGFKYEDVFRVIKTGLTDVSDSMIPVLENHALRYGLRGNKWFKAFEDEILEVERLKFIAPFEFLKLHLKAKQPIEKMVKTLFEYLMLSKMPGKIEAWIEYLKTEKVLDKVQENTQIWNKSLELFDQLIELEGDDIKTVQEFIRILEAGYGEMQLGLIPPTLDQIVVGSIERSKSKPTKIMYVIGLNDGVIPKKYSDEGILLDDEKLLLKKKGLDLETDANSIMARDYLSTYVAFSKASEKVIVSYALSDREGKSLRPSLYIDRLKRVFPKLKVESHLIEKAEVLEAYNPTSHYKLLTNALRAYTDAFEIDEKWFSVLQWYQQQPEWRDKVQTLREALSYDNQVEKISPSQAIKLYDLPLKASVSRLERYARCPYSHFVHYGLSPQKRKLYEIRLPDIGLLFHKTLEEFDRMMKEQDRSWQEIDRSEVDQLVEAIVDDLVLDYGYKIFESSSRYKYLIKKLKRVGKRAVWTLVTQVKQGEFVPYAHEIAFSLSGHQQVVPPIIIELDSGERMMLEGSIDRVDLYEQAGKQYVKIIDYKSGNKKFSLSEVYQGLQLQLIVYLEAILKNSHYFRADELYPAGVFYFKIDDPLLESEILKGDMTEDEILKKLKMDGLLLKDVSIATAMDMNIESNRKSTIIPFELKKDDQISTRSKVADETEFQALIDYVKKLLSTIGSEISEGHSKIEPIKNGQITGCMSCDYRSICQFDTSFGNEYRYLENFKDDEVLEKIQGKDGSDA